jgi:glyoxylase-like metal-dependent hydrolase (beta-lactamase superfamily II)
MQILKYSLGELQASCYLVIQNEECLIIDPGDEADLILEEIKRKRLKPVAILATHGHFDHVMAAGEIQASYDIPFYIDKKDRFLIERLDRTAAHYLTYQPVMLPIRKIEYLKEGQLKIEDLKLKVLSTPGHTPGSVCFYSKEEGVLFTGDTLFKDGIGRYDFSYASKKEIYKSLNKILELPDTTIVYPGHGEDTLIQTEQNLYSGKIKS